MPNELVGLKQPLLLLRVEPVGDLLGDEAGVADGAVPRQVLRPPHLGRQGLAEAKLLYPIQPSFIRIFP